MPFLLIRISQVNVASLVGVSYDVNQRGAESAQKNKYTIEMYQGKTEGKFDADAVGTGIIVLNSLMLVLEVGYIVLVECKAVSRGKAAVRHLSHKQQKSKKNKNQAQVVPTSRTEDVRTWGAGEAKGEASSD